MKIIRKIKTFIELIKKLHKETLDEEKNEN